MPTRLHPHAPGCHRTALFATQPTPGSERHPAPPSPSPPLLVVPRLLTRGAAWAGRLPLGAELLPLPPRVMSLPVVWKDNLGTFRHLLRLRTLRPSKSPRQGPNHAWLPSPLLLGHSAGRRVPQLSSPLEGQCGRGDQRRGVWQNPPVARGLLSWRPVPGVTDGTPNSSLCRAKQRRCRSTQARV